MTQRVTSRVNALAVTMALFLAACAKNPPPVLTPPAQAVSAAAIDSIQAALLAGDEREAKKQLKPLLKRDPLNPSLLLLQNAIDGDARKSLGPVNYAYNARAGDTIENVAARLLGNSLKAYELAKYNDLQFPVHLMPGQSIRIPGVPPRPKPQLAPERPQPKPSPAPTPVKPKLTPQPPPKASANPAAAQRARAAGLAALNRGSVAQAVGQLERAQALDPGNLQIQRDLQRARRIAATVKARK